MIQDFNGCARCRRDYHLKGPLCRAHGQSRSNDSLARCFSPERLRGLRRRSLPKPAQHHDCGGDAPNKCGILQQIIKLCNVKCDLKWHVAAEAAGLWKLWYDENGSKLTASQGMTTVWKPTVAIFPECQHPLNI